MVSWPIPTAIALRSSSALRSLPGVPCCPSSSGTPRAGRAIGAAAGLFANRTIRSTTLAVLIGAGTISMLEPLLPLDMTERLGAGAAAIGLAFGAAALAHLLASPAVGALADRRGSNG